MSGMNKSAYNGKRIGLLAMAVALMGGGMHSQMQGQSILSSLAFHHRTLRGGRSTNAAALKRASVKRRNIAKNPRGKHAQGGKQWKRA